MEGLEAKEINEYDGEKLQYQFGFQWRSNEDLIKTFIIGNRKSLKGYKRVIIITILSLIAWIIARNLISLIIMISFGLLAFIGLIGFLNIWRKNKNWEISQSLNRVVVKERTLRYGDFGIIFKHHSKHGLSQEKYVWGRYRSLIEWGNHLFLIPAKKKANIFLIREDEIGEENFKKFPADNLTIQI